jgi:hypothetical protein
MLISIEAIETIQSRELINHNAMGPKKSTVQANLLLTLVKYQNRNKKTENFCGNTSSPMAPQCIIINISDSFQRS